MSITSFGFLLLVTIGVMVYYLFPQKLQWVELLVVSLLFYYYAATPYTIGYLVVSTMIAYVSTMLISKLRNRTGCKPAVPLAITITALAVNILIWFVIKGRGLWALFAERLLSHVYISQVDSLLNMQLIAALGMGYYTLQILGYIIDCYWENITPQRNPLKLFLFVAYFT